MVRTLILGAAAFAATGVAAATLPSPIAEPGDPARWYEPADTPAKRHAVAMKEASAALQEALAECRQAANGDRRACESEARANYKADVAAAKELRAAPPAPAG